MYVSSCSSSEITESDSAESSSAVLTDSATRLSIDDFETATSPIAALSSSAAAEAVAVPVYNHAPAIRIRLAMEFSHHHHLQQQQSVVSRPNPEPSVYSVEKLLGTGMFGRVFLCRTHGDTGRPVAVKLLLDCNKGRRLSQMTLKSLHAESIAVGLQHPNVVKTLAVGWMVPDDNDDEAYTAAQIATKQRTRLTAAVVLDFVDGRDLAAIVKDHQHEAIDHTRRLRFSRDIAEALAYLHWRAVVHLDVKPDNVIVRRADDSCLLSDFGCSVRYSHDQIYRPTGDDDILPESLAEPSSDEPSSSDIGGQGTTHYRAPELLRRRSRADAFDLTALSKTDIYALAISMWQLVHRRKPYDGYFTSYREFQTAVVERGARPDGTYKSGERWSTDAACDSNTENDLEFARMCRWCWDTKSETRPSAVELAAYLRSKLNYNER